MMTRSGILVRPDNDTAPSLEDIALSLSRQPRFGGHAVRPWSVAEHSLACVLLVQRLPALIHLRSLTRQPILELYALLHDAHEAITGDVPSTWKTPDLKALQNNLDKRIFASFNLAPMSPGDSAVITQIDRVMLRAEAKLVGPPGSLERISFDMGVSGEPMPDALLAVQELFVSLDQYRSEEDVAESFISRATDLLAHC